LLDLYKEGTLNLIPWDELQIEKDIRGAGSQGTVYKAHWGSESVAIKKITLPPSTPSKFGSGRLSVSPEEEEAITALNREASYLVELRHPSIVQFYGITRIPEGKDVFGLVTKYMEHNLFGVIQEQVISQATPISWSTRLKWIRDLAFGLRYLHSKGINHGDIKSMNVLLSADLQSCQICDFGSAGRAATATLHTPQWSSPEVLQGGIYTRKSDVYSFGVLVWEIVTFHHPYERKSLLEAQRLIKAGQTPLVLWPELVPSDIPEVISKILDATLRKSASKRPSMEAICKSLSAQGPEEGTWTMLEPEDDGWVDPNAPVEDAFVHLDDASDVPPRRL
jgi:serine/threonine protein kinase